MQTLINLFRKETKTQGFSRVHVTAQLHGGHKEMDAILLGKSSYNKRIIVISYWPSNRGKYKCIAMHLHKIACMHGLHVSM